ncbi:methylglutaconyl-CoA hydratase [Burkholderiales bacterium]|nr:MAG: enoyl-CoA hydratase/isomerase family protein [Burkholderiales bacterium]CAG0995017.1 methylglutaconyl-CoA hydratase [Burkholderiales bacterium]
MSTLPTQFSTLKVTINHGIGVIALNRPEMHNAFNETLIEDLSEALKEMEARDEVRAVVLMGEGKSFCAGADLNWMKKMAGYSYEENYADAMGLANMLAILNRLKKPTIARIHGPTFGGGVGLVACCDIAIASTEASFALTEVKLGIIPATISPYVIEAMGARQARRFFLTAERFSAAEAFRVGLVHDLVPPERLDERVIEIYARLHECGPMAQAAAKELMRAVAHRQVRDDLIADTARRIADQRASEEGREGVAAFLAKRKPSWATAKE